MVKEASAKRASIKGAAKEGAAKEGAAKEAAVKKASEVFLTDVEAKVYGGDKRKKLKFFLKTPNLFAYRNLLEREFIDAEEIEFMVAIANEKGQRVAGYFQRIPVFDILFLSSREGQSSEKSSEMGSWSNLVERFKDKIKEGSFFILSRSYLGLFSSGAMEAGNFLKVMKQASEFVPVVYFPFISWKRAIDLGFIEAISGDNDLEDLEDLGDEDEDMEECNLILVLDEESEARLIEAFKQRMNEYIDAVEKALFDVLKQRTHVLAILETTIEGHPSWSFYFLKKESYQKISSELMFKGLSSLSSLANMNARERVRENAEKGEELIKKIISQEEILIDLAQALKKEHQYPQPFFYSGWLVSLINAMLHDPLENVFNFVYKKGFSIIFLTSVFYFRLKDDALRKRHAILYDKKALQELIFLYHEGIRTKKQEVIGQLESYKNALDSVLQVF